MELSGKLQYGIFWLGTLPPLGGPAASSESNICHVSVTVRRTHIGTCFQMG
jgi:hypothetical protein